MSNPAVIKLRSGKVGSSKVWLDDNLGESIHIHIDDYRVDLTVKEFEQLYSDLCHALNEILDIENFDIAKIDPVFLEVSLWSKLPGLTGVSYDKVKLSQMLAPVHSRIVPLAESMGVKALKGLSDNNNSFSRKSHHIGQDDNERMNLILESVKKNGYPYDDNYIIMYGNDNIIRDGQHRASCLYYLYGDIEVPVLRLHFKDYESPKIDRFYNNRIRIFFRKHRMKGVRVKAKKILLLLKKKKGRFTSDNKKNKNIIIDNELMELFNAK